MRFVSTRGGADPRTFSEAVEAGLAPDGGLFVPESLPDLSGRMADWERLPYPELAAEFLSLFAPEIPRAEWSDMTARAYRRFDDPAVAPIRRLDESTWVLELFHGPTLAFKDFALQLLGLLYGRQVGRSGRELAILGATSGDTGSAAIHGCLAVPGVRIFILYPAGRVAPLQERQMACTGAENVFAIPVPGTFDDAQRVVKETFADESFARSVHLSAVNSINIARILAQCVYYLWARLRLPAGVRETLEFVVPTGNFGNVLAGWLAQQAGALPGAVFRVATNRNDILYRFFTAGDYGLSPVQPSHAPSMDIQLASNFERFLYHILGGDARRVAGSMAELRSTGRLSVPDLPRHTFRASRMDDAELEETIRRVWRDHRYAVDPHTACAFGPAPDHRPRVVLATAHPAKFPDVVAAATGELPVHPALESLRNLPLRTYPLAADRDALKHFIRSRI